MPADRRGLGHPAPVPDVRPRRLLRQLAGPARDEALPRQRPSRHPLVRAGRGLGLLLPGRAVPRRASRPRWRGRDAPLRSAPKVREKFFRAAVDPGRRRSTECGLSTRRNHMQYLLLIYDNEAEMLANRTGSGEVMMKEYREFTDSILTSGHMKAGDALQPTSTATCVRIRNGKTLTTDGPFAET